MWERTCERHPPLKSKVAMQSEVLVTHELKVDNAGNSRKLTQCSKQAYEATTRQVAKEEYTLTHNSQGTHLDLPSDSQAWTAK
ncbi:unnamed protein product [Sphagnum balticum]